MTKRDPFFDVVKALAMLLVVIGHTRRAYGCQVGNPMIDNFIVGMNMPLFFMISGYFSAKTVTEGNWKKLGRHLVGYFWPVAVVSCVFAALAVAFGLEGAEKGLIGYAGRNFLFSPWYLWCLGVCFALTFIAYRIPRVPSWISLPALLLVLPFVTGIWHVGNVRSMLPHFLFGMFALRRWPIWKDRRVGIPCVTVYLLVVLLLTSFRKNGLSFYNGATDWMALRNIHNLMLYVARTALGFCGSIGILWAVNKSVQNFGCWRILPRFGTSTLGVYILHQWILARCVTLVPVGTSFIATLLVALLLFVACHYLVMALQSYGVLKKAIWGQWWLK